MACPLYFYSGTVGVAWLTLWLTDVSCEKADEDGNYDCEWNEAEALMVRTSSFFCSYLAIISLLLIQTNKDNDPLLKRLAFQMQYGLMAIIGCSIARSPTSGSGNQYAEAGDDDAYYLYEDEDGWFSIADKLFLFLAFLLLFAYTARMNDSPTLMVQKPHEGHGITSRTFLVMFCLMGMLPLVKRLPLPMIVPDGVEITDRAKYYYALTQCLALALLMLLFAPIHFGTLQDQRNCTIAIIVINCTIGLFMFCGSAWSEWIRSDVRWRLIIAPITICALAAAALSYENIGAVVHEIKEGVDERREERKERRERRKNKDGTFGEDTSQASSQSSKEESLLPAEKSEGIV